MSIVLPAMAFAQNPSPTPTTSPATQTAENEDLDSLKRKIREQERRLAQLESVKGEDTLRQIQREETLKLLKEMKLVADKHSDLRVFWKEGIRMETADGDFKLHIGTRIQTDAFWMSEHGFREKRPLGNRKVEDGVAFRRAFLVLDGQIYKDVEFKFEWDFASTTATGGKPQDVYMRLKNLPVVGALTVGHFKEPFSLEQLTSDANVTFMERSLADALAPARNMGMMLSDAVLKDASKAERATWAVGVFRDTNDFAFQQADGGYNFTGRATALPWYQNKGQQLLHTGVAYSGRSPEQATRFRQKPEAGLAPNLVDTGNIDARCAQLIQGEVATVIGPWHASGEYVTALLEEDEAAGESGCVSGFNLQSGYFLTGETRPYKTSTGTWDRVKPKKNFRENGGWGAWEVAGRYSFLDLNSDPMEVAGGRIQDVTAGLNWYLNPNTKIMWNYVHSWQDLSQNTTADIFMMRFQIDF